ncbi:MAG: S8 family serine peptidase [Candidatus Competibacteraceae bacterium]
MDTWVDAAHPDLQEKITDWAEFGVMGNALATEPRDSDEHGTHCAGTLAGGNQSGRFIGMAPEARIAAALVLDGEKGGTDAQVLAGIDWAVEQGVDVISMSLGGLVLDAETPDTYTEAILTCIEAGIPVVAAIGNEGHQTTGSPGNDLFALSVGATDPTDRVAGFSGGRTQIIRDSDYIHPDYLPLPYSKPDLSAPGVGVYSCTPGGNGNLSMALRWLRRTSPAQ